MTSEVLRNAPSIYQCELSKLEWEQRQTRLLFRETGIIYMYMMINSKPISHNICQVRIPPKGYVEYKGSQEDINSTVSSSHRLSKTFV